MKIRYEQDKKEKKPFGCSQSRIVYSNAKHVDSVSSWEIGLQGLRHSPESFFEEDGKEDDSDARSDLDDDLDEISASLEVLADHQSRRFTHQGDGDAHQGSVTASASNQTER